MASGASGRRIPDWLRDIFSTDPDQSTKHQVLSAFIVVGSVLLAGGAAFFMLELVGSLVGDSQSIVGQASDPNAGRFIVADAFLQVDEAGDVVLNEFVGLGPGASPLNLSRTEIRIEAGNQSATFTAAPDGNVSFQSIAARDQDGSMQAPYFLMDARDLVQVRFDLAAAGISITGGETILHSQHDQDGALVASYGFQVPASVAKSSLQTLRVMST